MSKVPFVLSFDSPTYYNHDIFPNNMYRRLHERVHHPLDMYTLGLMARLGVHQHHKKNNGDLATIHVNENKKDFEIHLDVGLFQPEDLSVKLVNDFIVVEGNHEEKEDEHGHVSRHFVRRYALPKDCDADKIVSTMSVDGVLTVRVPKLQDTTTTERIIQIQQTGPSDLFIKNNGEKEN
ncbi:heat shock protein 67B3-like [Teleopsis dalmanni]|uniref:heat shock protein 67B3-like n=1 Tax=Teleopsis dalmanni TaxID=139649 RepID=UPI0018CC914B|nr:heat shock protein 67B3-like [Teleopsis dalmanni]XP_037933628.1 heat shock protein 67B3-like [Teleopsis dalmanni]XP_037935910.1 heat shock protein 67B3-like [Teleopsis dalmanni]